MADYNKISYDNICESFKNKSPGIYLFGRIKTWEVDKDDSYETIIEIFNNKYTKSQLKHIITNTYINRPAAECPDSGWEDDEGMEYDHSYSYYDNLFPLEIIIITSNKDILYRQQITLDNWNNGKILDNIGELN